MSRSYRKTTIFGNSTARSEKDFKKIWHGMARAKNKENIKKSIRNNSFDDMVNHVEEDVFNVYFLPKDGKQYWSKKSMAKKVEDGLIDSHYIRKIMSK